MNNLHRHNEDIEGINEYIDLLINDKSVTLNLLDDKNFIDNVNEINEQFGDLDFSKGAHYNMLKLIGNVLKDKDLEGVILDKHGNPIASVDKDEVEDPEEETEEEEIEDVFGQSDEDKELIRQAKDAIAATDALLALSVPAGATTITKDGNILKDNYTNYESLKVFFKGTTILSVVIGGGEEIKETFAGFMDFQIQTMKKTGRGYILNLTSQKMRKDSSLLLYVKQLTEKPQTNLGQLAYNRGKFIGDPKQMSFEIVKIK